jgi:hypothetical protein
MRLFGRIERALARLAHADGAEEWRVPPGIALETLACAEFFASFPRWLTAASHLRGDDATLRRVAGPGGGAAAARRALAPAGAALTPALTYHAYASLAGRTVTAATTMTAQGTCWRQQDAQLVPLEHGWAFTVREMVCLGAPDEVEDFRQRGIRRALTFAASLGLDAEIAAGADPFFAPASARRALEQQRKSLKHELRLPHGGERGLAAASFRHHRSFLARPFGIRLADGSPAAGASIAFGIERWMLAVLAAHGLVEERWPAVEAAAAAAGAIG